MASDGTSNKDTSVLFVCLGNICRSPMAEGVFQRALLAMNHSSNQNVARIDSCGTGAYHARAPPDSRTMSTLKKNGIKSYMHSARKIRTADFTDFDYLLAMDNENLEDLQEMREALVKKGKSEERLGKIMLFGRFGGVNKEEEVVDPYYGDHNGFDIAYEQMERFSKGFLEHLQKEGTKTG